MASKSVEYIIGLRDRFTQKMSNMQNATNKFNSSIGGTIAGFASLAAVGGVIMASVRKMAEFEEKMDNLQAITGATGDQLDYLKKKAIEMGAATGLGAANTVEAFKLIASAKPELLENAEALASVTKEAAILSKASGMTMQEAAMSLTSALNQFNLSADQSARIINVLGAGAKYSAAEIPDLTESIQEFGTAANSMGISVEQSAAMVETLSEKGLVGRRAGIQLRNVLIKLAGSGDKNLNPAIVGVNKALENMAGMSKDTTALTKMFGQESMIAAQVLIQQRKRVEELTGALTGTNTAYEQAAVNSDNLNTDVKKLSGTWDKFVLGIEAGDGGISKFLRTSIKGITALINLIDETYKGAETRGKELADTRTESYSKEIEQLKTKEEKLTRINEITEKYNTLLNKYKRTPGGLINLELLSKSDKTNITQYQSILDKMDKMKSGVLNPISKPNADEILKGVFGEEVPESMTAKITAAAPKVFNINIDKMIENFTVSTTSVKEGSNDIREKVKQALQEALVDVQAAAL